MTIIAHIRQRAVANPEVVAVVDQHQVLTFAELIAAIDDEALRLRAAGVAIGDRIGLCLPDGAPALIASLAVVAAGGVHTPIDPHLATPERTALREQTGITWWLDATGLHPTGIAAVADPLGSGASAFLRFTSGTTGDAKGVLLAHGTLQARAEAAGLALGLQSGDRMLWLLPLAYHWAASVVAALVAGCGVVFGNRLRASDTAAIARAQGTTIAYASPWHCRRLAALPTGSLGPLREIVCTTAALDAQVAAQLRTVHGLRVRQALGIIECGLPLVGSGDPDEGPGDVGRPAAGFSCQIRNPDVDGSGELIITGPGLYDAYLSPWRPAPSGGFATGDRARLLADGRVRLLGRIKDLINVGGVKVFPQEVETVLLAHPAVARCRAQAHSDARLGEVVAVTVTPLDTAADPATLINDLRLWCDDRLAELKRPVAWTIAELPVTGSGKVRRS